MKIKSFLMAIACIAAGALDVSAQDLKVTPPDGSVSSEVKGYQNVNGGSVYYIKNVATGKYLKAGGTYGTQLVEGSAGMPITVIRNQNMVQFKTFNNKRCISSVREPYVDTPLDGNSNGPAWTLIKIEGTDSQYYIVCADDLYLYSTGEKDNVVKCIEYNKDVVNDDRFKWVFLDDAEIKKQMAQSSVEYDCTPLLKAADFDMLDFPIEENDNAEYVNNWTGYNTYKSLIGHIEKFYSANSPETKDVNYVAFFKYNYASGELDFSNYPGFNISQTLEEMPAGKYKVRFQGFYTYLDNTDGSKKDKTLDVKATFFDKSGSIPHKTRNDFDPRSDEKAMSLLDDPHENVVTIEASLTTKSSVQFSVNMPSKGGSVLPPRDISAWLCLDNIKITYHPSTAADYTLKYKIDVANKINETWEKVQQLNDAGQNAYRNFSDNNLTIKTVSAAISKYESSASIANDVDVSDVYAVVDAAYAAALHAHSTVNKEDCTVFIKNPGFELGSLAFWEDCPTESDTKATKSVDRFVTSNLEGEYLFNTFRSNEWSDAYALKQTISNLSNGLYKLTAKVTSHTGRTVYLYGNHSYAGKVVSDNGTFEEHSVEFLVENDTATIGAVGGSSLYRDGDNSKFTYFVPVNGGYFKADHFRLTRVDDLGPGRVKLAVAKAREELKGFTQDGKDHFNTHINLDNITATGDGTAQVNAIEAALTAAAKAQRTAGADMTRYITNPSFDDGMNGWNVPGKTEGGEVGVFYKDKKLCAGSDAWRLFNNWKSENYGDGLIVQSVSGLPEGTYKLTARMASDNGADMNITGNGVTGTHKAVGDYAMNEVDVEFYVSGNENVDIQVNAINAEGDNRWYKVDDFRLRYQGPGLVLKEKATTLPVSEEKVKAASVIKPSSVTTDRVIYKGNWSTLVLPYEVEIPDNLDVWEFTTTALKSNGSDGQEVVVTLTKVTEKFQPGVPYMVKLTANDSIAIPGATGVNVDLTTPVHDKENGLDHIEVEGTYVYTNVPVGAWFISGNKYWQAQDEDGEKDPTKTTKISTTKAQGFRAYINTTYSKDTNVKGVRYVFAEDTTTGIDAAEIDNGGVVAVYGLDGRRLDAPRRGVNIVKMSDGTTQKVLVK